MANGVSNHGKHLNAASIAALDLRVLLVNGSYSFDPDHNFVSDVVANEISVGGYARGTLANKSATEDDAGDFAYIDADDQVFAALAAGQTVGGAWLYVHNAADAAAVLLAFYDVTDTPTNGGSVTIQWGAPAAGGVLKVA